MVADWYKDPVWQNMLLFPWMDEEALLLSEVYTEMEMEEYKGRWNKRTVTPLNNYKDLFTNVEPQGTRILVKGDPGIGKSTFVQKLALDWATKQLGRFDLVLVVKLKFADKSQTVASMVKDQIKTLWEDDKISEKDIASYMKSGRDRVLLVLDGLDEINLKQYPQVREILLGERYRKCCILATTRPHVAETLYNKMTNITKIKGLSSEQAEQFVGNFLGGDELVEFVRQLDERKMLQMHQVPLIVQALALIFKERHKLPRTYTITYDQLVFFMRKSCEKSKELTKEELQAAMDEINQLAFKGLIRDDKKLVFSRDEIKDDNVRKLGILTAEKAGSGFNPTEVLQFAHKTVQEHSASDHVVKGLLSNDRVPWEALMAQFHEDASPKYEEVLCPINEGYASNKYLTDGKETLTTWLAKNPEVGRKTSLQVANFHKTLHSNDDLEAAFPYVSQEFTPLLERVEYNKTLFRFIIGKLADHPAVRDVILQEMAVLLVQHSYDPDTDDVLPVQEIESFLWDLKSESLPDARITEFRYVEGTQAPGQLRSPERFLNGDNLERGTHSSLQVLKKEANFIPRVTGHKRRRKRRKVLDAELVSLDNLDLKGASLSDGNNDVDDNIAELEPFSISPAVIHLKSTMRFPKVESSEQDTLCALKVSGTTANIPEFIPKVASHIKHLRNIHVVELQSIDGLHHDQNHSSTFQDFTTALYQFPSLVSMELSEVDPKLTRLLIQNLPLSVRRLSVGTVPGGRNPREEFTFPPEVHLVTLHLYNCLSRLENLFRNTAFPHLKKISIKGDSWEDRHLLTWTKEDAQSLLDAVRTGRMSELEDLIIRECCLKGCGPELVEILKAESLCSAEFVGAELSIEDGKIILENIQDGNMNLEFLNLLDNEEMDPLTTDLKTVCEQWDITLEMNPAPESDAASSPVTTVISGFTQDQVGKDAASDVTKKDAASDVTKKDATSDVTKKDAASDVMKKDTASDVMKKDAAAYVASLASGFTSEETQGIQTFISRLTPTQAQNLVSQTSNLTPEQVQTRLTIFSHSKTQLKKSSPRPTLGPQCTSGVIRTNVTKTVKNVAFQIESSCRMQPANIANEALESQLVLGALCVLLPKLLHSVRKLKQQEPKEDSDRDDDLELD